MPAKEHKAHGSLIQSSRPHAVLMLAACSLLLSGCIGDVLRGIFEFYVGAFLVCCIAVVNVLALVGLAITARQASKNVRAWLPVVFACIATGASFMLVSFSYGMFSLVLFTRVMLFGTMLPSFWLIASIVLPLRVRQNLPGDLSPEARNWLAIGGFLVGAIWFGFVAWVSVSELSHTVKTLETERKAAEQRAKATAAAPLEVKTLRIGSTHGCATTKRGLYCWPKMQLIQPDKDLALWGSELCTGDMRSLVCRDFKTNKQIRKVPVGVRKLGIGPGGGCMESWDNNVLCWTTTGEVYEAGATKTLASVAIGKELACGVIDHETVGCWKLGSKNAPLVKVAGIKGANNIVAVGEQFCVEHEDRLKCWGPGKTALNGPNDKAKGRIVTVGKAGLKGLSVGTEHACGIGEEGTLWCWGSATAGALGNGAFSGTEAEAVKVETPGAVKAVSAGHQSTCIQLRYGVDHYCWGRNDVGQLPVDAKATGDCGGVRCVPKPTKVHLVVPK